MPDKCTQMKILQNVRHRVRHIVQFLQTIFGHQEFRPGQREAIKSILSGEDTGGGKTAIYTLPCIMTPGLAFVVSPLIMLMIDQVPVFVHLASLSSTEAFWAFLLAKMVKPSWLL